MDLAQQKQQAAHLLHPLNWPISTHSYLSSFPFSAGSWWSSRKNRFPWTTGKALGYFSTFPFRHLIYFWWLSSSGKAKHPHDLEGLHDTSRVETHGQKQHIALGERSVLGFTCIKDATLLRYLLSVQLNSTSENYLAITITENDTNLYSKKGL